MVLKQIRIYRLLTCLLVLLGVALGMMSALGYFTTPAEPEMASKETSGFPATPQAAVLRVGMSVRSLGSLDNQRETFTADLDVWFIGYDLPNAADFTFPDAVSPLTLGEAVVLRKTNNLDYARYRVAGTFRYRATSADLISGHNHVAIRIVDAAKPLSNVLLFPDDEGSNLQPGEDERALTTDGAWAVTSSNLVARRIIRATLGDPEVVGSQLSHGEIVASYTLKPVSPSLYQIVQKFIPQKLALPVMIAVTGLLVALPVLARFGYWSSPWRWFTVQAAFALLLASGQTVFETYLAPELVPETIKTVLVVDSALWLALIATFIIALLPLVVWRPLERRSGNPTSALERAAVNVAISAAFLLYFLAHTLDLSPASIGAASGVLTVVLGIALQNLILDLFSGILLNLERPFRIRHHVSISVSGSPVQGQVRNMNWRTTQLQTRDNDVVSIPNSIVARSTIKNHATPNTVSRDRVEFVLPAHVNTQTARRTMRDGALRAAETGMVLEQPPPSVVIIGVEDYGIRYRVRYFLNLNIHTNSGAYNSVAENVLAILAETGIQLAMREFDPASEWKQPVIPSGPTPMQSDSKVIRLPLPSPKVANTVLSSSDITLIRDSWAKVRPLGETVAVLFYNRLFEIAPSLQNLFRSDSHAQRQKLVMMLSMLVKSLDNTDALLETLADLGLRHETYGVKAADYEPVGAALLWTLAKGLGDAFDEPTRAAWTHLYVAASGAMTSASGRMMA